MFQFRRKSMAKILARGLLAPQWMVFLIVVFIAFAGACATFAGAMFFFADKDLPQFARAILFGLIPVLVGINIAVQMSDTVNTISDLRYGFAKDLKTALTTSNVSRSKIRKALAASLEYHYPTINSRTASSWSNHDLPRIVQHFRNNSNIFPKSKA